MKGLRTKRSATASPYKRPVDFGKRKLETLEHQQGNFGSVSNTSRNLTTDDARCFIYEVKREFKDQVEELQHFLDTMADFKAKKIDVNCVVARMKELFKGHNNLIYGFNTFLPVGYEITLDEEKRPPIVFEDALNYVNKIKGQFGDEEPVYQAFLDILDKYRKDEITICMVYDEISHIFKDHPDLTEEFARFLPDSSKCNTGTNEIRNSNLVDRKSDNYNSNMDFHFQCLNTSKKAALDVEGSGVSTLLATALDKIADGVSQMKIEKNAEATFQREEKGKGIISEDYEMVSSEEARQDEALNNNNSVALNEDFFAFLRKIKALF